MADIDAELIDTLNEAAERCRYSAKMTNNASWAASSENHANAIDRAVALLERIDDLAARIHMVLTEGE